MRKLLIPALALTTVPAFAVNPFLTEALWNPTGTDAPFEFFEIQGDPNASLNNVYVFSIEGDADSTSGNAGAIDARIGPLNFNLGSNGLALIRQGTASPFLNAPDAATTIVTGGWTVDLENGANTFLVVQAANPIWTLITDIDSDNDGVVDSGLLSGFTVIGAVGVRDSFATTNNDKSYGAQFGGKDSTFTGPAFAYNVLTTAGNAPGAWVFGLQTGLSGTNFNNGPYLIGAASFADVNPPMTNVDLPNLTPGRPNLAWQVPLSSTISGTVTLQNTSDDGAAGTETITWTLSNGTNSYTSDFTVNDFGGGAYSFDIPAAVANGAYTLSFDGGTFLKSTFNVTLSGSSLTQAVSLRNGDIDNDTEVGPGDFEAVVAQFGGPGDADVDNDGEVGPADFEIVIANFGLGDN